MAAAWALVQFLSGVWAGVFGANIPFLHGLVAGIPALVLGLVVASPLPLQFVEHGLVPGTRRGTVGRGPDALHAGTQGKRD